MADLLWSLEVGVVVEGVEDVLGVGSEDDCAVGRPFERGRAKADGDHLDSVLVHHRSDCGDVFAKECFGIVDGVGKDHVGGHGQLSAVGNGQRSLTAAPDLLLAELVESAEGVGGDGVPVGLGAFGHPRFAVRHLGEYKGKRTTPNSPTIGPALTAFPQGEWLKSRPGHSNRSVSGTG